MTTPSVQPTIGQIVHYVWEIPDDGGDIAPGKYCSAAIVTGNGTGPGETAGQTSLYVFRPPLFGGGVTVQGVQAHQVTDPIDSGASGYEPETWHWPEGAQA